jgi:CheY-like chemotaxis protein
VVFVIQALVSVSLPYWYNGYSDVTVAARHRNVHKPVFGDPAMSDSTPTAPPKPRVLVADDEQVIANTLAIILNQAGFEARAVYSGEKAIESLETFEPDMLISDVIMTGMTGIEAAIATRAKRPNCKILLFSGQAATADLLEKARAQGHEFEILAKPVHPTDLLAKLRRQ